MRSTPTGSEAQRGLLVEIEAAKLDPEGVPALPKPLVAFYGSGYERAESSEDTCTLSIEIRTPRALSWRVS